MKKSIKAVIAIMAVIIIALSGLLIYVHTDSQKKIQAAMQSVRARFGSNAVLHGTNYLEGATTRERNTQIGGHRA